MSEQHNERRLVVVTGGTSGIGRATVEHLLSAGAGVIAVARDRERCQRAEADLRATRPGSWVHFIAADLSTSDAVRAAAEEIRRLLEAEQRDGIDALINNAAFVSTWRTVTPEGYEQQFAVNHLAPFLLTRELFPALRNGSPGRAIVVSSGSHRHTRMRWDDLMLTRRYSMLRAYKQSKLANVLFAVEFNRRETGVRAYVFDPGLVRTEIGLKHSGGLERAVWRMRSRAASDPAVPAEHLSRLAITDEIPQPEAVYRFLGEPASPSRAGLDPHSGRRLWAISARLCGVEAGATA